MKTIILTLTLIISSLFVNAQQEETSAEVGTTITVTVPVKSDQGKVLFALYDETSFLKQPLQGQQSDIIDGKASVTFSNVTPGVYAVVLFHDTNGNEQMDFEPNGMPKEMYGVSNNIMNMGPPQWKDARFEVKNNPLELEIIM